MGYDETVVFLRVLQLLVYVLSTEYDRERNAAKTTTITTTTSTITTAAMSPRLRYTARAPSTRRTRPLVRRLIVSRVCRRLIDTDARPSSSTAINAAAAAAVVAASTVPSGLLNHHVQPPSDPIVASVLHPRQNPRPGRLLLENVNNRPQTMDRGTQANAADPDVTVGAAPPSTSNEPPTNNELVSARNHYVIQNVRPRGRVVVPPFFSISTWAQLDLAPTSTKY